MVLHKHVCVLSHHLSVSSCIFGSTCFFMYIWSHPPNAHILSFLNIGALCNADLKFRLSYVC